MTGTNERMPTASLQEAVEGSLRAVLEVRMDDYYWYNSEVDRHRLESGRPNPFDGPPSAVPVVGDPFEYAVVKKLTDLQVVEEARRRFSGQAARELPDAVDLGELLDEPDDPVPYLIDGLWPKGGKVVLSAQFKAGKTTLTGNLIRALVDGEPFLGRFDVQPIDGNIVLIDNEMNRNTLRRWLRDQGIVNVHRVKVFSLEGRAGTFNVMDPKTRQEWAEKLVKLNCSVLIFDCLRPALDALGLSEDKDAGAFLVALTALKVAAGIGEVLTVHHMGHVGERPRGDSSIRGHVDAEWHLIRPPTKDDEGREVDDPAGTRYFSAYGRDVMVAEGQLSYNDGNRHLTFAGGNRRTAKIDAVMIKVLQFIKDNPGAAKSAVERIGGDAKLIRQAVDQGVQNGLIAEGNRGRKGVAHPLSLTLQGHAQLASSVGSVEFGDDLAPNPIGTSVVRYITNRGTEVRIDEVGEVGTSVATEVGPEPALVNLCDCGRVADPDTGLCWQCG